MNLEGINLKGVKHLDARLRKKKNSLNLEEMWQRILGSGYYQPFCPLCGEPLKLTECTIEYELAPGLGKKHFLWHLRTATPTIIVKLRCLHCNVEIKGQGYGLSYDSEGLAFESLRMTSIDKKEE